MRDRRVLILGGTHDARELARLLMEDGCSVITSLAGVTENPLLPPGEIRRGGFGGIEGLTRYLADQRIGALVDATHPFAAQMSRHAHAACGIAGVPLLRFEREAWAPEPGDHWLGVADVAKAVAALPAGARALVTIGRKEIAAFFERADISGIARMIEEPVGEAPSRWRVLRERPPFTSEAEAELMLANRISHLVTKNAGGSDTGAKLVAARQLVLPVIMIERPVKPASPCFAVKSALVEAVRRVLCP